MLSYRYGEIIMKKQFTPLYRIWHWLMALSTLGLLFTVFLRKTFLSWHTNADIIQTQLAVLGTDISAQSAKVVAKAIRAPMWEWHYVLGLVLGISILIRFYMILTKQGEIPLIALFKANDIHERIKYSVYLVLCSILIFMSVTGGLIYFYEFFGFTKEFAHDIKELHELMLYPLITVVLLHFAGVLRHEFTTKEGIISKMIHGD